MLSLASSDTFPLRRADTFGKIMNWETSNLSFMLNLQLCVALLMRSVVHEFNVFAALNKWNFALYSNLGIVAHFIENYVRC